MILWARGLSRAQHGPLISAPQCLGLQLGRLRGRGQYRAVGLGSSGGLSHSQVWRGCWLQTGTLVRLSARAPTRGCCTRLNFLWHGDLRALTHGSGLCVRVSQGQRWELQGLFHLVLEVTEYYFWHIQLTTRKLVACPDSRGGDTDLPLPGKIV